MAIPARRASDYKPTIWAAGTAVYRIRNGKPEFLLVHRPRYNDWSLPKGKLDKRGESFATAAERETEEECGVTGKLERSIGTVGYVTGAGNNKVVRYWLLRADRFNFVPNPEVDKARWYRPKKALSKATYTRDMAIIKAAIPMTKGRTEGKILLVRHVDAGNKRRWRPNDAFRPISKKGHEQLGPLLSRLLRTPINRIISSPVLRCEQTVGPVAMRLGLHVRTSKRLKREATTDDFMLLARKNQGRRILLCSHGEVIGPLISRLAADPKVRVVGDLKWPKGSIWELTTRKGRIVSARYIPRP
jgi:8-oxo-dGTP diphosphatase